MNSIVSLTFQGGLFSHLFLPVGRKRDGSLRSSLIARNSQLCSLPSVLCSPLLDLCHLPLCTPLIKLKAFSLVPPACRQAGVPSPSSCFFVCLFEPGQNLLINIIKICYSHFMRTHCIRLFCFQHTLRFLSFEIYTYIKTGFGGRR